MRIGGDWTRTNEDRSRGIYSPLQLPLCDTPRKEKSNEFNQKTLFALSEFKIMLAKGIEPSTVRLQVGRSTIELHQQNREFMLANFPLSSQVQQSVPLQTWQIPLEASASLGWLPGGIGRARSS